MDSKRVGVDCTANLNTGTFLSPVWVAIPLTREVQIDMPASAADASDRASILKQWLIAMLDVDVTLNCNDNLGDTALGLIRTAHFARSRTPLDIAFADGSMATSGVQFFRCQYVVTDWQRGEPLEEVATRDITLKPAIGAVAAMGTV